MPSKFDDIKMDNEQVAGLFPMLTEFLYFF